MLLKLRCRRQAAAAATLQLAPGSKPWLMASGGGVDRPYRSMHGCQGSSTVIEMSCHVQDLYFDQSIAHTHTRAHAMVHWSSSCPQCSVRPRGNLDSVSRRSSCKWVHDLQKARSSAVHCFCAAAGGRRQRTNLRKTTVILEQKCSKARGVSCPLTFARCCEAARA